MSDKKEKFNGIPGLEKLMAILTDPDNGNLKGLQNIMNERAGIKPVGQTDPSVPGLPGVSPLPGVPSQYPVLSSAQGLPGVPPKMADGGLVDDSELPPSDEGYGDKLKAVLSAMGMGAEKLLTPLKPLAAPAVAAQTVASSPAIQNAASGIGNSLLGAVGAGNPLPTHPTPNTDIQAATMPQTPLKMSDTATPPPQMASKAPEMAKQAPNLPPAADLLSQITNGDNDKMAALLEHLKDQDKRSQWAQVLGVIGDTFGNVGQAKAGQTPSGFTTQKTLSDMNETSKKSQLDNLTQSIANDPMSSTSKMAQMTLMQSMGIKPGDPRAARIQSMSARAITGIMPQMNDAVKAQIDREKASVEEKHLQAELGNQDLARKTAAENAAREDRKVNIDAAQDVLKNTSSIRDFIPGNGPRDAARHTLEQGMSNGPSHGVPDLGSTFNGHKVTKVTRIK